MVAILLLALFCPVGASVHASAPVFGYEVVHVYPHDRNAFTQGLIYANGFFHEGTGLYGGSSLRKVEVESGVVRMRHDLPPEIFGEGVTALRDTLYQITWQDHLGYSYVERDSFELIATWPYAWDGWGLTHDGTHLIASDGSSTIRFLDPRTRAETSQIQVLDDGVPVNYLNELEWVQGRIYANVLPGSRIAVIHPASGHVEAWIDLAGLRDSVSYDPQSNILNGIAFDPVETRLFVTGKRWPKLFEIDVPPLHGTGVPQGAGTRPGGRFGLRICPNPGSGRTRIAFSVPSERRARTSAGWEDVRVSRGWHRDSATSRDGLPYDPGLRGGSSVSLRVFDPRGRLVRTLLDGDGATGRRVVDLDLDDLTVGAYLVQIMSGEISETEKLLIVR